MLSFEYGPVFCYGDAHARGMLCQLELLRPHERLALYFGYLRQDDHGEYVLGWIEIAFESDSLAAHQELASQLYESLSEIAFLHGIHLHNEEENLSSTVTITVSEQRTCYRNWNDEEWRGPSGSVLVGGSLCRSNEAEESGT